MKHIVSLALGLVIAGASTAQVQRVYIGGLPTNLSADWGLVVTAPDGAMWDAFLAFMPLSALPAWASWDSDMAMDSGFGPGNWLRCRMEALSWAYLSPDACAHQPAPGQSAPLSLLTTDYDFGFYSGVVGLPFFPGSTLFFGSWESYIAGSAPAWSVERWQLRSRGFWPADDWNACPGGLPNGPNFTGWIAVRFHYSFH